VVIGRWDAGFQQVVDELTRRAIPVEFVDVTSWRPERPRNRAGGIILAVAGTLFTKLNDGWNAEPNAPDPAVVVEDADVLLYFDLNPFQFPQFEDGQRAHLRFVGAWRCRLGATNDEGWYRGQCRFSGLAPAWGEFYEVVGDLLLGRCPDDWQYVTREPAKNLRHFLFYLRDGTFECDARTYSFDLG
jgi:hypothetical protein